MSADVIIRVEDVKKYYNDGKVKALDGVSTEIRRGEVVVIICLLYTSDAADE